jgi:hypothetical protein
VTVPVGTMASGRFRAYLGVIAFWWLGYAYTFAVSANRLAANHTFDVVENLMPVRWFSLVFAVLGVAALAVALVPRHRPARLVLYVSTFVAMLFGLCLAFAGTTSPASVGFIGFACANIIASGASR